MVSPKKTKVCFKSYTIIKQIGVANVIDKLFNCETCSKVYKVES